MRQGFGMITCGHCREKIPVVWVGKKFKIPCPKCGKTQMVTNVRLKNFKALKENKK